MNHDPDQIVEQRRGQRSAKHAAVDPQEACRRGVEPSRGATIPGDRIDFKKGNAGPVLRGALGRARAQAPIRLVLLVLLTVAVAGVMLYAVTHPEQLPGRGPGGGRGKNHPLMLTFTVGPVVLVVLWAIFLRGLRRD